MKPNKHKPKAKRRYVSTGSTMLNLACTDKPTSGFLLGKVYLLVGDSKAGKTFLALTTLAEASINPKLNNYRLIYDNCEDGALMNIESLFGTRLVERLEPPRWMDEEPLYSDTIEEFYDNVDDTIKEGQPFIYILDSMDSLTSFQEITKYIEQKNARRKGKEVKGSYGDGKARVNSGSLRRLIKPLRHNESLLILIAQTRDSFKDFAPKSRSGGRALTFYSTMEIWTAVLGELYKIVDGVREHVGTDIKAQQRKNRIKGRRPTITFPIYFDSGIADVDSCVDWLISRKYWKRDSNTIKAPEFDWKGSRIGLIRKIERENLEKDLQGVVADYWIQVEAKCRQKRKKKYNE